MKKLMFLALLIGLGALAARLFEQRREWQGLTESEAKAKLLHRISAKLDDERAEVVATRVVAKLRQRGLVVPDPA